jgi:hypothetical protein
MMSPNSDLGSNNILLKQRTSNRKGMFEIDSNINIRFLQYSTADICTRLGKSNTSSRTGKATSTMNCRLSTLEEVIS